MHLLLTGAPGSGKTTVLRRAAQELPALPAGFYTEEVREHGERLGFRLVRFDGHEALIAHVSFPKTHRVGKYGVNVVAIDAAAEALAPRRAADLYLVDEIGKMECLSERFVMALRVLLDSGRTVVATVASKGEGFIGEVKRRPDCELWTLSRANRDAMPKQILDWARDRK